MTELEQGADRAKTDRQSHILEQLDTQEKNLDLLKSANAELLTRLIPALREDVSPPNAKPEKDLTSLAPLAEKLRDNNNRISYVIGDINDAINRLEL